MFHKTKTHLCRQNNQCGVWKLHQVRIRISKHEREYENLMCKIKKDLPIFFIQSMYSNDIFELQPSKIRPVNYQNRKRYAEGPKKCQIDWYQNIPGMQTWQHRVDRRMGSDTKGYYTSTRTHYEYFVSTIVLSRGIYSTQPWWWQ